MNKYLKYPLFFAFIITALTILQVKVFEFLGIDAYYHAKTVLLILENNSLVSEYPWLYYTILNNDFVEHHLLFHILLLPFFKILSPFLAAKAAVIFFGTSFFTVYLFILNKLNIKFPIFWTILLFFSSSVFIFRLNLLRAQSLALILLFLGVYFLLKNKVWLLLPITVLYTWLFDGFVMLGILIGIKLGVDLYYLFKQKKGELKNIILPLIVYLLGIMIAIIFNPYFPRNIHHTFFHLYQVALKDPFSQMPVGIEWHAATADILLMSSGMIVLIFIGLIFYTLLAKLNRFKLDKQMSWLLAASILFFILSIAVRRMIEYSAPLLILTCAFIFTRNYHAIEKYLKKLKPKIKNALLAAVLIIILVIAGGNFYQAFISLNYNLPKKQAARAASRWIADNINRNEIIYHLDWGESAMFAYYNPDNFYISGLDPNFMKEYDQGLYRKWNQLFMQNALAESYSIIKYDFQSNTVLINKNYSKFIDHAYSDKRFNQRYENDKYVIFELQ